MLEWLWFLDSYSKLVSDWLCPIHLDLHRNSKLVMCMQDKAC